MDTEIGWRMPAIYDPLKLHSFTYTPTIVFLFDKTVTVVNVALPNYRDNIEYEYKLKLYSLLLFMAQYIFLSSYDL